MCNTSQIAARFSFLQFVSAALLTISLTLTACAADYSIVATGSPYGNSYAVVVSKATYAQKDWRGVADALVRKHAATLVIYDGAVAESRTALSAKMPRFTAFVARPEECGRDYIAEVHRLTRRLDDDPWLDTQWGVITGADASQALRVASVTAPLEIKKVLTTTHLNSALFDDYFVIGDGRQSDTWLWKKADGTTEQGTPQASAAGSIGVLRNSASTFGNDHAAQWAKHLEMNPDLVVSSAHGYENGLEMPFSRGIVRVVNGKLYPIPSVRQQVPSPGTAPIGESSNSKVYFPLGNCLIGHVNGQHCMVTTMMGPYGVNQLAGYTVNTWFGRGGWGMLGVWQTLPGRNSFGESFFFNQQGMLRDIAAIDPKALDYKIRLGSGNVEIEGHIRDMIGAGLKFDPRKTNPSRGGTKSPDYQLAGLLWDIDTVAFYGDPAWRAVLNSEKEPRFLTTGLVSNGNTHTFTVEILNETVAAQNSTPIGVIFTTRLKNVKILSGQEYEPVVADNFILLFNPRPKAGEKEIVVKFSGEPVK
ncbi:MAG: hypothetical protein LBV28_06045 [Puniceicoccales bacterium]|jgi:zinc protease|nr:hypothetical protein [Puniceicoccales bacterium]